MKKVSLDKSSLQLIAVMAMVVDHCDFLVSDMWLRGVCHFIGRITIIIMSFFVAEGYYKTGNVYKYIIRMGIFALVSQIPFGLLHFGRFPDNMYQIFDCFYNNRNVIFTLFIALILLVILKSDNSIFIKCTSVAAALFVSRNSDWNWGCILWVLGFAKFYDDKKKQILWAVFVILLKIAVKTVCFIIDINQNGFSYVSLYYLLLQVGGFMAIPLLMSYNGEKGKSYGLGFYLFYPIHMAVLFLMGILF